MKEATSQSCATPATVSACHNMLLRGSCKWGSSCKYSHDAGVLAAARKLSVIDFLPAHAVFKKTGLDLITPPSPSASPQSCYKLFTVDSGFPSHDEGSNLSIHSDLKYKLFTVDSGFPSHD